MIYLTEDLMPSNLFRDDNVPGSARRLLGRVRTARQKGNLREAERIAQELLGGFRRETTGRLEHAAAFICLCDIYREMGRLGPALDCAKAAADILQRQHSQAQQHNEAVAQYNLALIHHLLGEKTEALDRYEDAGRRFGNARDFWTQKAANTEAGECERLKGWIGQLIESLTEPEDQGGLYTTMVVPGRAIGSSAPPAYVADFDIRDEPVLVSRVMLEGRTFEVDALPEGGAVTLCKGNYHILEIPPADRTWLRARDDDRLLLRSPAGSGNLWLYYARQDASGTDLGYFVRENSTPPMVRFVKVDARIIGGWGTAPPDDYVYPVALLRACA